jgi:hypothetical protein
MFSPNTRTPFLLATFMTEPESNSITSEELATRVRRVVGRRFRRDAALEHAPTPNAKAVAKAKNWTAQGYDLLIISLAIFLVTMLVQNLSVAGSWRERGNQWGDRARWQRELHAWEQQLAKQEHQLELECQRLAATLIAHRGPDEQQQALDRVSELRQRLREANQSLGATIRQGNGQSFASRNSDSDPDQLSATALKTKREQLIEMQYAARSQYNAEHPTLQAIEHQLEELDRQLALSEEQPRAENSSNSESRVQVIENQYLRNASSSPKPRVALVPAELAQQFQGVEQRFEQHRQTTDRFLRDIASQQQTLQQTDIQRATAWEQVANSLRAMARECAIPATLKQSVDKQDELRSEPTIAPWSLLLCLVISYAIGGAIVWYSNLPAATVPTPVKDESRDEKLSVNLVTKQLGCAPGAIVPWDVQPTETIAEIATVSTAVTGKTLQQRMRFASECLLAVTIAATVMLALTHGQFGDWLIANPLTAWGRWMGS